MKTGSLQVRKFTFNPFSENTYVVHAPDRTCMIVDPGCYTREEQKKLADFIEKNKLSPVAVINTHCHIDHVLGNQFLKERYSIPLYIPADEQEVLGSVPLYAPMYGFGGYSAAEPDRLLIAGELLTIGTSVLEVLSVPGHSPGHLAYFSQEQLFCLAGDVLFYESVGRTDLPGGNHHTLMESIRNVMYSLPPKTTVFCGHGPETTIVHEMHNNPFCPIA